MKAEESDLEAKYGKEIFGQIRKDITELEKLQKLDTEDNSLLHLAAESGKFNTVRYLVVGTQVTKS